MSSNIEYDKKYKNPIFEPINGVLFHRSGRPNVTEDDDE